MTGRPSPRFAARFARRDGCAADAAIGALALRLAGHARAVGLFVERVALSRTHGSHSRHLRLRDEGSGAGWSAYRNIRAIPTV